MNKLSLFTLATVITAFGLTGCGKPNNPLLNDETVADLKRFVAFNPDDKEFDPQCKNYLTSKEKPDTALKARCDKTVNLIAKKFKDREAFVKASPDDLWDPKLWERIFGSAKSE